MLLVSALAAGGAADEPAPGTPDVLRRIIAATEASGEPLRSESRPDEPSTYYLRSAEYLGACAAPFGTVHLAKLFFIRSGNPGQATPPARGHTFLVFLDANFRVRGFWRDAEGDFHPRGSMLFDGDKLVFDYAKLRADSAHTTPLSYPHPPVWK